MLSLTLAWVDGSHRGFGSWVGPNGVSHVTEEDYPFMLELEVRLDFACCCCQNDLGVTLKCTGSGLSFNPRGHASVKVPCPTCGEILRLKFSTDGTVHHVEPVLQVLHVAEPSYN